jgi:hypothetical protein
VLGTRPAVRSASLESQTRRQQLQSYRGNEISLGARATPSSHDKGSQLLTADELALALKVSKAAVRAWQRRGIPFVPIGRLRRYVLIDVIEWHRQRAAETTATAE